MDMDIQLLVQQSNTLMNQVKKVGQLLMLRASDTLSNFKFEEKHSTVTLEEFSNAIQEIQSKNEEFVPFTQSGYFLRDLALNPSTSQESVLEEIANMEYLDVLVSDLFYNKEIISIFGNFGCSNIEIVNKNDFEFIVVQGRDLSEEDFEDCEYAWIPVYLLEIYNEKTKNLRFNTMLDQYVDTLISRLLIQPLNLALKNR